MIASTQNTATTGKSLALTVLLAALVASLMLAAKPAHASTSQRRQDQEEPVQQRNRRQRRIARLLARRKEGRLQQRRQAGLEPGGRPRDLPRKHLRWFGKEEPHQQPRGRRRFPGFLPEGTKIAYESQGVQTLNPEGDWEVFRMSASDGKDKKNHTDNGLDVTDEHPSGAGNGHIERSP
jgi:hypothetical protein